MWPFQKKEKVSYPRIKEVDGWYGVQKDSYAFYDVRPEFLMDSWNTDIYVRDYCLTQFKEHAEGVLAKVQQELFKLELIDRLRRAP